MSTVTAQMATLSATASPTTSAGLTGALYLRLFAEAPTDPHRRRLMNQISQWRWRDRYTTNEIAQRLEMTGESLSEAALSFSDLQGVLRSPSRLLFGADGEPKSVRELAVGLGISARALHRRLERMTPEQALVRPRAAGPKFYTVGGVRRSQAGWARALELATSTLSHRLQQRIANGEDEQQAIEHEVSMATAK